MLSQISQSDSEKLEGKNKVKKGVSFQNENFFFFWCTTQNNPDLQKF